MTRLIDADALKYTQQVMYKKGDSDEVFVEWFISATEIDNAPTVDAVQVVRCKDCKHWDEHSQYGFDSENGVYGNYCMLWTPDDDFYAVETPADGFCFKAKRKDEEADK